MTRRLTVALLTAAWAGMCGGVEVTLPLAGRNIPLVSSIDIGQRELPIEYAQVERIGTRVTARAVVELAPGVRVEVKDVLSRVDSDSFDLARVVEVKRADGGAEPAFFTTVGVRVEDFTFAGVDPFIPSAMYKHMFDERANPKAIAIKSTDEHFEFREDRLPLPIVAGRDRRTGLSLALTLHDTGNETILADAFGRETDPAYRFGGVGFVRNPATDALALRVTYPGNDRRTWGLGARRHPAVNGQRDEYRVRFRVATDVSYAEMVERTWRAGVDLYRPKVRTVDLQTARKGILDTLYAYRQSPDGDQDLVKSKVKAPGFPWSVKLKDDFPVVDNTYEIGFVGSQPVAAYALLQAGVLAKNAGWRRHAEAVLDFWAKEGLTDLGLPKQRYYPLQGEWDRWHCTEATMRQASTGMVGIFDAWNFLRKRGESRPEWLAACRRYGEWLLRHQAADGSWPMAWSPITKVNGDHPVVKSNKALTLCAIPFLSRLVRATGEERWRAAALKAGEFAWRCNHEDYLYVAAIVDNPQVHDSESGYEALKAFLALYDLDRQSKWLTAARQAATYTETWVYMHEVPPERDAKRGTDWPFDRSVVGQHVLTVNQPAADLGFAWTAFEFDRLARLQRDEHFRYMSRIALHNTKQSMNLGGKLYPGRPEGLQLEASNLRTAWKAPRRTHCVTEALTWNFAAHLWPLAQFLETPGLAGLGAAFTMCGD